MRFWVVFAAFTFSFPLVQAEVASFAALDQIKTADQRISDATQQDAIESPGQVVVVYFTPRDRAPATDHVARIRRIVGETKKFYDTELARHGFADRGLKFLTTDTGEIKIINVVGQDKDYDKPDGRRIRDECLIVLRKHQVKADESVLLLFCNLMDYDKVRSRISHHSPYYGGGSHLSGTAWQCDSEILDPRRLTDLTPIRDGEYGNITIGRHNSIFIGGVIHELGHALSLPHCRERVDERQRGTALMGSGNRTFAQERRGEGRGTFLTQAHALWLAGHPAFRKQVPASLASRPKTSRPKTSRPKTSRPKTQWSDLSFRVTDDHRIEVHGSVDAEHPVHGVIAYFDPAGGSNYDATTATGVPDGEGQFAFRSGPLKPGKAAELRLVACHVNGMTTTKRFAYSVNKGGVPDLSKIRTSLELATVIDRLRASDLPGAELELKSVAGKDAELQAIGNNLLQRFQALPSDGLSISLTSLRPIAAKVGWIRPTYNSVPSKGKLLMLDGEIFARGIYAHAPAEHAYQLDGNWETLEARCGLQTGNPGSVDFTIIGDGKTLWRSKKVTESNSASVSVSVRGVDKLQLIVGNANDGNGGDWGVWIDPVLSRSELNTKE